MESFDMMMNTRLPPRKRLLAGFLRHNSCCEFLPPIPVISGEFGARIRDVMNLPNSTLDEIIEVAESVALEAAEVAVVARKKAMEKAAVAAKAKAAAKGALELLESDVSIRGLKEDCLAKTKFRRKQVPIKLFYKTSRRAGSLESDEELARRLHHTMNSSPRITGHKKKKLDKSANEIVSDASVLRSTNSLVFLRESDEVSVEKLDEKIIECSKNEVFMEDEEECRYSGGRNNDVSDGGMTVTSRKAKHRRKKKLLSKFKVIDHRETNCSFTCDDYLSDKELHPECAEKVVPMEDVPSSINSETTKKISSMWKCNKKLKLSKCSSDSKFLHALC